MKSLIIMILLLVHFYDAASGIHTLPYWQGGFSFFLETSSERLPEKSVNNNKNNKIVLKQDYSFSF